MTALLGCGPEPTMTHDGGSDAGTEDDGGRTDAAATDAAATDAESGEDAMAFDGGALPRTCLSPGAADPGGTEEWEDALGTATVQVADREACLRSYTISTTAELREDEPGNPRTVAERSDWPTVRSGHDMFDALHALALEEVRELSVSSIRDWAFNDGDAVDCGGCLETGRLWNYVWTRDTAYAVDLGMAAVSPSRSRASLDFKLSERRGGGNLQVVQDTGTGGSYPVSTDRVSWAVGAWALLPYLTGSEREAFRERTYRALRNTLEHDRRVVFDPEDGLYFGEQSFLDWREQTYPGWTADDVVHIGMSKALNTNLLHLRALEIASVLASEDGDAGLEVRYRGWADELRETIQTRFWLEEEGLFSTFVTTFLDPAPVRHFDLLGSAFAVLFGVASEEQAARILATYPHYGPGASVIFPQQQLVRGYHNRGEWPFVTAYWLRAAKRARNDAVADRMVRALMRGAAINLSNMEVFEAELGEALRQDPQHGREPVNNSQRQLWSVAGYLSMVHHTLFGLEAEADGLHVRPYVTRGVRTAFLANSDSIVLNDYPWRERRITVVLHFPSSAAGAVGGAYGVSSVRLNGVELAGDLLPEAMLEGENRVDVILSDEGGSPATTLTERSPADWQSIFMPRTPRVTGLSDEGGRVRLTLEADPGEVTAVRWTIYRDGVAVVSELPGATTHWVDPESDANGPRSPCYAAEVTFISSGNHSQHSMPVCWWGPGNTRITTIDASEMTNVGGTWSTDHGRGHYEAWGDPGHSLTVNSFTASQTGPQLLQVTFGNGAGSIDTGITCAIKRIVVEDAATGAVVADGPVIMPHLATWSRWSGSSFVRAELEAGRAYRITIHGDDEMVNMSVFEHFQSYTAGNGGRSGAFNRANIADLKVLAR